MLHIPVVYSKMTSYSYVASAIFCFFFWPKTFSAQPFSKLTHTPWVKKSNPNDFLTRLIKKAQMSIIFDRDNCTSSVCVHLQVTSLMLLRTTCSFHGNDSRRVGAVDWLWTGDCRQNDWPVDKTIPGLYEGQREHFEHLLWLAVSYCLLLKCIVSNDL